MNDIEPQTAGGKVLWHFTMSLDGFVAGLPEREMRFSGIASVMTLMSLPICGNT
jgi:hypothetical protein